MFSFSNRKNANGLLFLPRDYLLLMRLCTSSTADAVFVRREGKFKRYFFQSEIRAKF